MRNPAHEQAVRDLVRDLTGKPVTCGHELTSGLDAPRRALTALLNARLIPLTASLIRAVRGRLDARGITAPLMVVKGDGSLIADRFALARPVETVLSGPAASVVGARWLTGREDCFVSDIGGTTTDIAILKDGRPLVNREGAQVGGWRTMVEAVEIRTFGLGGDSEVRLEPGFGLAVGPRRSVPLSLLVHQHPEMLAALRRQAERAEGISLDGRFALRLRALDTDTLSPPERRIWDALADGPQPLETVLSSHLLDRPLERLVARGLVILSGFTPTDAAHVLGLHGGWSRDAALLGAALWARRPAEPGWTPPADAEAFARSVLERLTADSALALVEAALARDGVADPAREARGLLPRRAVAGAPAASDLLRPALALGLPLGRHRRLGRDLLPGDRPAPRHRERGAGACRRHQRHRRGGQRRAAARHHHHHRAGGRPLPRPRPGRHPHLRQPGGGRRPCRGRGPRPRRGPGPRSRRPGGGGHRHPRRPCGGDGRRPRPVRRKHRHRHRRRAARMG